MSVQNNVVAKIDASYEEVPYESASFSQTHAQHLYTVGTLFNLAPPDFKVANILEIGCGNGGNLFSQAINYPKAKFFGFDLSKSAIALANQQKQQLKLSNIEFEALNIMDMDLKKYKGKFDYIICHGVYSWVPDFVQKRILEICNTVLSDKGIAVVSYNVLPGWNSVRSLREMMVYHTSRFSNAKDKVAQARMFLDFLAEGVHVENKVYHEFIKEERDRLATAADDYLYHEHLEALNKQFYLHEFVKEANENGLAYVGDINIPSMYANNMQEKTAAVIRSTDDGVVQEQYMDFVNNRRFRSSILCKATQRVDRVIDADKIMGMYVTTSLQPVEKNPDLKKDVVFKSRAGELTAHHEIAATVYMEMANAGSNPIAIKEVVARAQKKLGLKETGVIEGTIKGLAVELVLRGFISVSADCPAYTLEPSKKPVAYPLARLQAEMGANKWSFTNALGVTVPGDMMGALIIQNLDGTRTSDDIGQILADNIAQQKLSISKNGVALTDPVEIAKVAKQIAAESIQGLARNAFIVA